MELIVVKFGGTSMGSPERIRHSAEKIIALIKQGYQVAVVVSAISGETDRLISLAKTMAIEPDSREYAALITTGEQVSMALMAMYLMSRGYPARSFNAAQVPIITDENYKSARIQTIEVNVLQDCLSQSVIPVIAGFQGMTQDGSVTALGRGGSDTTAVAIAAVLKAKECQIFTDVDGVYTCDPRIVPMARRLSHITFDEMLELASLGAKVLQKRSVELASKYKVNLRVLSSFEAGNGTLITVEDQKMEQSLVSGIAFNRNEAKLSVRGIPDTLGVAARIIGEVSRAEIDIDMIIQNSSADGTTDLTFTVSREDYVRAFKLVEQLANELQAKEVRGDQKIAKISLVGVGMRSHRGVASQMFAILAEEGIHIQLISSAEIKISVVIDEKYLELAVRALHTGFKLDEPEVEEFDPESLPLKGLL
ncbi:MAG: aspartate kinase [Legionellales bacterium]|nr:aspartate kinase [Legionellales bacterium]